MDTNQLTVLIVDDEPDLCEIVAFDVSQAGFHAIIAHRGEEALALAKRRDVNIVITDVRMPGWDGLALLKHLKTTDFSKPTVLFMSAFTDITPEEAYDLGAEGILPKPMELAILHDALDSARVSDEHRWTISRPRHFSLTVDLKLKGWGHPGSLQLGRGGIFLPWKGNPPYPGEFVAFKIACEGTPDLIGNGVVRWVRTEVSAKKPPGLGIEFYYLEKPGREAVFDWLNRHPTPKFIPRN